jgi:predicted nucleic acid-binding protein
MNGGDFFFDTNVLLYLLSGDAAKADRAEQLLARGGVISVQALDEFAAVTRGKFGMALSEIGDILSSIRSLCKVVPLDVETHQKGLQLAQRYGFSVYDAMIVAAALLCGCRVLVTEDLNNGQRLEDRLTIYNPFV